MSTATARTLPAGPQPANRNSLVMGTAAVCAAGTMLMFGMLAIWFKFRDASPLRTDEKGKLIHDWLPSEIKVPEVAANTLMITMVIACIIAGSILLAPSIIIGYAVKAAARDDLENGR